MTRSLAICSLAHWKLVLVLAGLALSTPLGAQAPVFDNRGQRTSDTGHELIAWQASGEVALIVSRTRDFSAERELYRGDNSAFFLSGLAGGRYFLLLRDGDGRQSEVLELVVEHQSLQQAIWLTIMGAIIALGIVATIIRGARP